MIIVKVELNVKCFLGCSKGIEPSPTESQSVMLTVTPRATLNGTGCWNRTSARPSSRAHEV